MFLPIMRGTLSAPAARDPEVLERLECTSLNNLCHLYQNCLNKLATEVSADQDKLTKQIATVSNLGVFLPVHCRVVFQIYICDRLTRNRLR